MTSSLIRLRPATLDDVPILEGVNDTAESAGFEWFGFAAPQVRKTIEEGKALGDFASPGGMLVVEVEGQVAALVSWHPTIYGPNRYPVLNIGIGVVPELRGKGYGTEAQRLLVEYLFHHTNVNRIEAQTDAENIAEQRALEKAGFRREGVLRGAQFRMGEWHDMACYGMTRADHEELRKAAASATKVRTGFTA